MDIWLVMPAEGHEGSWDQTKKSFSPEPKESMEKS